MKTDPLRRRLDRLEAKHQAPAELRGIRWVIVEPSPCGGPPVPTGEVVEWHPGEPSPWQAPHAPE